MKIVTSIGSATTFHSVHNGEWAEFYVKSGNNASLLSDHDNIWIILTIHSSFGCFGHYWYNAGPITWWEFLSKLDKDYFLKKVMEKDMMWEFSPEDTILNMKNYLISVRKDYSVDKTQARDAWKFIEMLEKTISWEPPTADTFSRFMNDDEFWHEEFYDFFRYRYSNTADGLWDRIWVPFMTELKQSEQLQHAV